MTKKILLISIISLIFAVSCSQWRVSSMKPNRIVSIKNGSEPGQAYIKIDDNGLDSLSTYLGIFNNRILLVDNAMKRVQTMDTDGKVELVIGQTKPQVQSKIKQSNFNFNIMGSYTIDSRKNIYIQNRVSRTAAMPKPSQDETDFAPSYILVFNKDGELQYTLGQRGTPDLPFYYIEFLDIDKQGRLFVVSRSFDSWSVFRFEEKKRDYFINLSAVEFKDKEESNIYTGKIENIKIFQTGETLLLSVAYYHDLRFKYRKVFEYSIQSGKVEKLIITIPDPKNVLFNLADDKIIYFWNIDKNSVKFMLSNLDGNILNNISLKIEDTNNLYSRIMSDKSGKFYSYHIRKDGIELLQWE